MKVRGACCALILAIIGGCGGSDGDSPVAVSPTPAAPGETPAPGPSAPAPAPGETPAPGPSGPAPAPGPPDAPAPPEAPPPIESKASIRGDVLIAALSLESYSGAIGGVVAGRRLDYPSTATSVEQRAERDASNPQNPGGRYDFNSAGYMNRGPFIMTRYDLATARVSGSWAMAGGGSTRTFALAEQIEADTGQAREQLAKPGGLVVSAAQAYELDQTLGQWTAQAGDVAWRASLQVQSDYADDLFRVCWELHYPARIRTSCGVFGREQGDLRGAHIVDDSQGMGRLTWRSSSLPSAPPGALPSVSGEVLIKALSLARYSDPVNGPAVGQFTGGTPSTTTFVEQRVDADGSQTPSGRYAFESAGYMNRDPSISPRYDLRPASVTGRWTESGSGAEATLALGDQMVGDDAQEKLSLPNPGGVVISAGQRYVLDDTVAQWTRTDVPIHWDASLQIHSDNVQDWFRVCWQMTYTEVFRQSCGLFNRQSGDLAGVYVVDSLHGEAPLIWRSAEMPQAASGFGRLVPEAPGGQR
jgi:hypothetical protein